jgi:hypothetical protein
MAAKERIRTTDFVADVRSGMTDEDLMKKYELETDALENAFTQLIVVGALTIEELDARTVRQNSQVEAPNLRRLPRNYLVFKISVHDAKDLRREGWVTDLTEIGLQIAGLASEIGQIRSLLIRSDQYVDVFPFGFDAVCRWVERDGVTGEYSAGYEITSIPTGSLQELRKLIHRVTLGDA